MAARYFLDSFSAQLIDIAKNNHPGRNSRYDALKAKAFGLIYDVLIIVTTENAVTERAHVVRFEENSNTSLVAVIMSVTP